MVLTRTLSEDFHAPLTTAEIRQWCRIDDDQDELMLAGMIDAATLLVEQATSLTLAARLYEFEFTPAEGPRFRIAAAPIIDIQSVGLRDDSGTTTPLEPSEFNVSKGDTAWTVTVPRLSVPPGTTIVAQVETGYASSADVPAPLRHAIAVFVGAHYADREGGQTVERAERTVAALIAPYRVSTLP